MSLVRQLLTAVVAALVLSLAVINWLFGRLVFEVIPYSLLRDKWYGSGLPPRIRSGRGGWTRLGRRYKD
jgi:hypothetical protein